MPRLLALFLVAVCSCTVSAQEQEAPARVFPPFGQPVGNFTLKERSGKMIGPRDLVGKIWVAQFFYPGCNLCSRNTPSMQKLQDANRGRSDVRLVSIALNDDSPETLQSFARDHGADRCWL